MPRPAEILSCLKAPFIVQHLGQHFPRWHVHLTFDQPLLGPGAIGTGRHGGLSLFAMVQNAGECRPSETESSFR